MSGDLSDQYRNAHWLTSARVKRMPATWVEAGLGVFNLVRRPPQRLQVSDSPAKITPVMYSNYCFLFHSSIHFPHQLPPALGVAGRCRSQSQLSSERRQGYSKSPVHRRPQRKTNDHPHTHTHTPKNTHRHLQFRQCRAHSLKTFGLCTEVGVTREQAFRGSSLIG